MSKPDSCREPDPDDLELDLRSDSHDKMGERCVCECEILHLILDDALKILRNHLKVELKSNCVQLRRERFNWIDCFVNVILTSGSQFWVTGSRANRPQNDFKNTTKAAPC